MDICTPIKMAFPPEFGEDELRWKFDRCVNDALLKTLAAAALSYVGAKMFFSKQHRRSVLATGIGAAFGLAWYTCEMEMQTSLRLCKDGVDKIIPCEECNKNMEERRKRREARMKELEERRKKLEKQRLKEMAENE